MSWNQQPYNPAWSQPQGSGPPAGPGYGRPYNPGFSQPPPTHSLPPGGYSQAPPPTHSVPPGGYSRAPPPTHSVPPGGYSQAPPPTHSVPPGGYSQAPPPTYSVPPGGYSHPPSQGGGGYRGYAAPPPRVDPELWSWFQSVDADRSGKITAIELQQALLNSNWSHFNAETCRLLIGMFDANRDGTIDVQEFEALWKYVQDWKGCFDRFDKDKSGNIDAHELQQALVSFGYSLSMEFCSLCTRVFDRSDKQTMKFDDFIQCCVMLRSLTESFKRSDTNRTGVVTISYEQFLEMAIDNTMV